LPTAVAIRLLPLPAYDSAKMEFRAEIDRGEVVLARPKLDKDGHKKWHPPVSDRPTLTLYARVGKGEVALGRWPTTIGGWKTIEKSDGSMALKYKESVTGDAIWPEIIGPGYRAAYGLVALMHHQIEGVNERGEPELVDQAPPSWSTRKPRLGCQAHVLRRRRDAAGRLGQADRDCAVDRRRAMDGLASQLEIPVGCLRWLAGCMSPAHATSPPA